ncbi:MAG: glycosyltransferase family 4 protein [Verrucomicrobiales bacterium]
MKAGLFLSHPVQYHVCLWRGLAARSDLDVRVFYFSDQGVNATMDPGFARLVEWDVPLLDGYTSEFLRRDPVAQVTRSSIPEVDAFLAQNSFDVVFLHGYMHAYARQLLARRRKYGYKVVMRGEFTDMRPPGSSPLKDVLRDVYLRWNYRKVDHFCPIGSDAIDHLRRMGVAESRMTLTPYSVDDGLIARQRATTERVEARKTLGLADDALLFLFSGKLIPRKQPLLLAEAAASLAHDPRLAVAYLGSGEQMAEVEARLRPVLGNRLILPGFVNQSELGRYFAAADVFVLPTAYDTWGLVVNEAMHWGLPCIVSDRTGCRRDLIAEGETGFIHPWSDASALAALMQRFLDNPALAPQMGKLAGQRIEGFRSELVVDRLYEALVGGP